MILKAETDEHYQTIARLAEIIIPDFYADIVPHEHNLFFVQKFQSLPAIKEQVSNGYEYFLLQKDNETVGYVGLQPRGTVLFLSKLYLLKEHRGLGLGAKAMELVLQKATEHGSTTTELIVNCKNLRTIKFYETRGFTIAEKMTNSFENGHSVQDYRMVKVNG